MEDDTVVIEGSPLHRYMKELELNNLTFDEKLSFKESNKKEICVHGFWYNTSVKEYICSKFNELRNNFSHIFPLSQDVLVSLSRRYYTEYGRLILDSKVMLEDDIDYLCMQTPHQFLKSVKIFSQDQNLNSSRYSALAGVLLFAILSIFFTDFTPSLVQFFIYLVVFGVACFNIRLEIIMEMWKRRHDSNLQLLRKFLSTSEQLNSVIRKSIRLIQEVEVVSRGYKLVNGKTPITRLESGESPTSRLFTKLRFVVLRSTIRTTMACRRATTDLLNYKLDVECDCDKQNYICNIPLNELGGCFVEETTPVEMFSITDGYSLCVLKSLNEVLVGQRSELLTRLSLALSGITWDFTSEGFIENFHHILEEPYKTTVDCVASLQSSFESHRNAENMRKNVTEQVKTDGKSVTSALKINLRSLQVHTRAALHNSMEFEDDLKRNDNVDMSSTADITDKFSKVRMHLESGLECFQQCLKEMELMKGKNGTCGNPDIKPVEIPPLDGNKEEDKEKLPLVEIEEEVILEDRIYEGVAGSSESETEEEDSTLEVLQSPERIKEESEHVIQELRSVLAVKTSEKQREMWKKQLFPSYRGGGGTMVNNAKKNGVNNAKNNAKNNGLNNAKNNGNIGTIGNHGDNNNNGHLNKGITNNGEQLTNNEINNGQKNNNSDSVFPENLDNLSETLLVVPKRISAPGRPPTRKSLKKNLQNNHGNPEVSVLLNHDNTESKPFNHDNNKCSESPNHDKSEQSDWTRGLGIGFSASMAQQVAKIAQNRKTNIEVLLSDNGLNNDQD